MQDSACRCWCTASRPTRRSTSSTARRRSSRTTLAPLARALPGPAGWCSSTSPRARPRSTSRSTGRTSPPPSPRTTCCTTATRSSWAASARTTTACRCSSARSIAGAGRGGDQRQPEVFPRHRQRAAARTAKETACGCAGIYTAHAAIELYADAFEEAGALDKLEAFASCHGPRLLRAAAQTGDTITLVRENGRCRETLTFGDEIVVPLHAGETIPWKLA